MRCLACGAEMHLMQVVQDGTMPVPGFEHHTFMCSACGDVERRLVFTRDGQSDVEPVPVHPAPPTAPASTLQNECLAGPGVLRRVFARLRGRNAGKKLGQG